MAVRALPHVAGRSRVGEGVHTHARGLDTLARETVEGHRCSHRGGTDERGLAVDVDGHGADLAAAGRQRGAGDVDDEMRARQDGAEHLRVPGLEARAIESGGKLGHSGGPHAVDDNAGQAGEFGCGVRDVDRVAVARDDGERVHGLRRVELEAVAVRLGLLDDGLATRCLRDFVPALASTDGELLVEEGKEFAIGLDFDRDGDDTSELRVGDFAKLRGDVELRGVRELAAQLQVVVQVDEVEQALDDGRAIRRLSGGDEREDGRPGLADQDVGGHAGLAGRVASGDVLVGCAIFGG